MQASLQKFTDANATLIAIDPHEIWSAKFLLKDAGVPGDDVYFPFLQDAALSVSAAYGVAFQMRIHVELSNRPATFIIDKNGVIRFAKRGVRFNDRPSLQELLNELEKINDE